MGKSRSLDPRTARLLFVAGLHRSGTSVFTRILGTHPLVRTMEGTGVPEDEGQHLQSVLSTAREHGGPGLFGFDPGSHLTEATEAPDDAARVLAAWLPHWHLTAVDPENIILVEKSPPNLVRLRLLQAWFPQASFVVVIRHPVVVALSTQRWRPELSLGTLIRHWVVAHDAYRTDRPHLRRLLEVRYESLVSDPRRSLSRLAMHLDICDVFDIAAVDPTRSDTYLAAMNDAVARLRPSERAALERDAAAWGYSFTPTS